MENKKKRKTALFTNYTEPLDKVVYTKKQGTFLKTIALLIFCCILCAGPSYSTIITVMQDGSGDHETIQEAILASKHGDTVLVYPGTYYENVDFTGKNITLASLNIITDEDEYKHNTIIDGNHTGSCIKVNTNETSPVVHGFTLQNGIINRKE